MPLRLLVNGSHGRMGQTVIACAKTDPIVAVAAEIDADDDLEAALDGCDAVIDFRHDSVTERLARECAARGKILVVGTTGQTDAQIAAVKAAAQSIPIVLAPNFSVG